MKPDPWPCLSGVPKLGEIIAEREGEAEFS